LSISDSKFNKEESVMKSFVSSIAALSIALFVVGCGGSPDAGTDTTDTTTTEDMMHDEVEVAEEAGEEADAGEEAAPAGEEAAPAGEEAAPAGEEAAPAGEEAAPAEGEKAAE
jgi:hypothetical protein